MTTSRLLGYAALGIIAGLLIENTSIRTKNAVKLKANDLKNKFSNKAHDAKKYFK